MSTEEKKAGPDGGIVEKRIKKTVIRRRRVAAPKSAPEPKPEEPVAAPAQTAKVPETVEVVEAAETVKAAKPVEPVEKEKAAPVETQPAELTQAVSQTLKPAGKIQVISLPEPPVEKVAKPPVETQPNVPMADKPGSDKRGQQPPAQDHHKEVKVFGKEPPGKRVAPTPQAFKGGKKRRTRPQARPKHLRRNQVVQSSRPLMKTEITTPGAAKRVIRIVEAISVADLSQRLGVKAGEIIKKLMAIGVMSTVNQLIDFDAASLIATEFGYEVEAGGPQEDTLLGLDVIGGEDGTDIQKRAPVVTVMGHVDHGKTSLLDVIRKANVVSGEAGGITQHIGAYHVYLKNGDITFLDTPGHEAFTAMRARGARATDIVVLVVASDDGVKPQTVEAINHAKEAEVPIIVAINKIDLPDANPDRVRQELSQYGLISEDWGGDTLFVEVSAKQETNIDVLLENIVLQSDVLELTAPVDMSAKGLIVEAKLDKGRGPVATVLIQKGTLKVGDAFVTGMESGRIRALVSDTGKRVEEAGPSIPIEILGLSAVPSAGDDFAVVKDEATARQVVTIRKRKAEEAGLEKSAKVSLEDLYDQITKGEVKDLKIIVKADVQGSVEAVTDALAKIESDLINITPIHTGVGGISEGDCTLAAASNAIVVGFNVRPELKAQRIAERESVDIRLYNVIYDLVEDLRNAMEGMLEPIIREKVVATVEVRDVIRISKVGNIAGCYVTDGSVTRNTRARLLRDNIVIYDAKIGSLKRFKEDVKEVASGYECGITIEGYNDYKSGDVIEVYVHEEEAQKL